MRQPHGGAAGQTFDSHDETESGMKGHENTTLRPSPPGCRSCWSLCFCRPPRSSRAPCQRSSRRGAIPADRASIRGRADDLETVNMACLPVKRPLRCTAHVAVTLRCVQFCRSPKVLEKICGSTAPVNIFTFACGKTSPQVCLTYLSSHIHLHLTPIASSPEWHAQPELVAIGRHNGVGRLCRRAGNLRDADHTDGTKMNGPQEPPCFHPSG